VKTAARKTGSKPAQSTAAVPKTTDTKTAAAKPAKATPAESPAESKDEAAEKKKESGYITAGNRRDPFVSPVVEHLGGSGCSTGKRCLAIDQIALRGIVKSDGGMIAVVVNSLDKAYFLRENDPVFNGYVLKISGDSVVFKETVQDKLGHLSTREVVKKITTPAV
jgi:Tfp pilus assembly protein PilP